MHQEKFLRGLLFGLGALLFSGFVFVSTPALAQEPTATPLTQPTATPTPGAQGSVAQSSSAAASSSVGNPPVERGISPLDFEAKYYDHYVISGGQLLPQNLVAQEAYSPPVDFVRSCFSNIPPWLECALHEDLTDGNTYAVVWEGTILVPVDGDYTFILRNVDDGGAVYIDGNLVADYLFNPGPDPDLYSDAVPLTAGAHTIKIEYVQAIRFVASLQLNWAGPGFLEETIPVYQPYACPLPGSQLSPVANEMFDFVVDENQNPVLADQKYCQNNYEGLLVLPPGPPAYQELANLMADAKFEVNYAVMYWYPDLGDTSPGDLIVPGLRQLYDRVAHATEQEYPNGMKVRILIGLDTFGPVGTRNALDDLRELDIPLRDNLGSDLDHRDWTVEVARYPLGFTRHSHSRILVVDGHTAFTGGFDPNYQYLNEDDANIGGQPFALADMGIVVKGPIAHDVQKRFNELWSGAIGKCKPPSNVPYFEIPPDQVTGCEEAFYTVEDAGLLAFHPTGTLNAFSLDRDSDNNVLAEDAIITAIEGTSSEIKILNPRFNVEANNLSGLERWPKAVAEAILNNGVSVTMVLSKEREDGGDFNVRSIDYLRSVLRTEATAAGQNPDDVLNKLDVALLNNTHAKAISFDNEVLILGTSNFDASSWTTTFGSGSVLFGSLDLAEYNLAVDSTIAAQEFGSVHATLRGDAAQLEAFLNPQVDLNAAIAAAPDGAIIFLRPGVFQGGVIVDKPITIIGSGVRETVIECQQAEVGFLVTSSDVRISNLEIRGCDEGIVVLDSSPNSLENFEASNNLFTQAEITGIAIRSLIPLSPVNFTIENNTFVGGASGVSIELSFPQANPSYIKQNIFAGQSVPIEIFPEDGHNTEYSYNLFFDCSLGPCSSNWHTGTLGAMSSEHDNIFDSDPLFANVGAGDYKLSSGSPAIDAGDPTVASSGQDVLLIAYDGDEDGSFFSDLGALEYEPPSVNRLPDANAGGPYQADEGTTVIFDAGLSSDPDGDPLSFIWDFDRDQIWDTPASSDPTAQFTWQDDFTGQPAVSVSDGGRTANAFTSIQILNVAPSVDAGADRAALVGDTIQFEGLFSDPGGDDTHTIEWDFGDGNTASGTLTPSHTYDDEGSYTVTLTVTDDDGGVGTDTLEVEIEQVGLAIGSFVVLGEEGVYLKQNAQVLSGNVGANLAVGGPYLAGSQEVTIGISVDVLDPASTVFGDSVKLKQYSMVYDVHYNDLSGNGTAQGQEFTPLELPLVTAFPQVPVFSPGTQDFDISQSGALTLDEGSYGVLLARNGSTITFTGGTYDFAEWDVRQNVTLNFEASSEVRIEGKLMVDQGSYLGPSPNATTMDAADILIYVTGQNGNNGNIGATPKAAKFGIGVTLIANVYVPNGTLYIRQNSVATGAFLGKWVTIGIGATVDLESGW